MFLRREPTIEYLGAIGGVSGTLSLGVPSSDRVIVVAFCVSYGTSVGLISATINGVAATTACLMTKGGNSINPTSGIFYANVPTGTSGTISATFTGVSTCYMVAHAISGVGLSPSATATDATGADAFGLTVPASGGYVFGASTQVGASAQTWTGIPKVYEVGANSTVHSLGASSGVMPAGSLALSTSPANAGNGNAASAVWGVAV